MNRIISVFFLSHWQAQNYCDCLNKIIWKIRSDNLDIDGHRIATEATERLWFKNEKCKWMIVWNSEKELFEVVHRKK